jgi:hypothetical protein
LIAYLPVLPTGRQAQAGILKKITEIPQTGKRYRGDYEMLKENALMQVPSLLEGYSTP